MRTKLLVIFGLVALTRGQLVDDFTCPDEFAGFYPHLISCDKYWSCSEGVAELKTCGNGLAFLDTDETFTLEQCAELHLVECGERTELEPPISTRNCPRLYGTFADPEDCGVFWKCMDGKSNRYNCPPGLAYDQVSRGCRWADEVPECSGPQIVVDEEGGEFVCPAGAAAGTFTKHAHPADCRQYFLCIGGIPREYGCPLGTVFNDGTGTGVDGKCSDPEEVPECANYYEGVDLDPRALRKSGFDSGKQSERVRTGSSRRPVPRAQSNRPNPNSIRSGAANPQDNEISREEVRPAPASLEKIVSNTNRIRPSRPQVRPAPASRPLESSPPRATPSRGKPSLPSRLTVSSPRPAPPAVLPAAQPAARPNRLQVLTDRPNIRNTFPKRPEIVSTEEPETTRPRFSPSSRFSTAGRPSFNSPLAPKPTTTSAPAPAPVVQNVAIDGEGLPPPVKAKSGPNGEDYFYYYYYYDEDEVPEKDENGDIIVVNESEDKTS